MTVVILLMISKSGGVVGTGEEGDKGDAGN